MNTIKFFLRDNQIEESIRKFLKFDTFTVVNNGCTNPYLPLLK